jgi:hypothetical protein
MTLIRIFSVGFNGNNTIKYYTNNGFQVSKHFTIIPIWNSWSICRQIWLYIGRFFTKYLVLRWYKIGGIKMVYEYTLNVMLCFFLFVDLKSKLADNTCLGGGASVLLLILKTIETIEFCFIFLFFYCLVDITYNTKDIQKMLIFISIKCPQF